jgi:membrane fusion protein (multidrug efflux system)
MVLLSAWGAWFLRGGVLVYATSEVGRVEVEREVHVVQSSVDGRVVRASLGIGEEVPEGAPIVELDARAERLALDEQRRKVSALTAQRKHLLREIAHRQHALLVDQEASRASIAEAAARLAEADLEALRGEDESQRAAALRRDDAISEREMLRAASEGSRLRAAAEARAAHASWVDADQRMRASAARAQLDALRREGAELAGDIGISRLAVAALEQALDKHLVRAPVEGALAEVAPLRPGTFVRAGEKLGSILPRGELRIVAEFLPASSLGRIRAGMPARFRLDGFPWTQFGSIGAVVTRVAAEVRQGRVRVEATILRDRAPRVPLQHGLPGALEVEIERASPAQLTLRGVSRLFKADGVPSPPPVTGS